LDISNLATVIGATLELLSHANLPRLVNPKVCFLVDNLC